jgi:hypothetical protein
MRKPAFIAIAVLFISLTSVFAQQPAGGSAVPVSVVASVEAKHGKEVPVIHREDVRVMHDRNRLPVTQWSPVLSREVGLQLLILVDDAADPSLGAQFADLQKFMQGLPDTVSVGVGYIRNGTVQMVHDVSADHAAAAKSLRLPIGLTAANSPYLAVTDAIKGWRESGPAREILLISSGIDWLQEGFVDTYLDDAIDQAQRAAVQVYGLYASSPGHLGHSYWRVTQGQNNLSRLADETGAETYFQGLQMPISYGPYLQQYADRLQHQFKLTFQATPGNKAGFHRVNLETEVPNADLVTQDRVWVPLEK